MKPYEIAQKAGLDPYSREYYTRLRYLLDHGYIVCTLPENKAVTALGLYRVTSKGLEEILGNP